MGKMTPELVDGYRKISKHVHANPDWRLFVIVDVFGSHMDSEKAMKLWYEAKIFMGKEEGGTYHICQAYDYQVAKMDNSSSGKAISALKNVSFLYKGVVDQYGLVHACCYAIRETTAETWIKSFTKVNLTPSVGVDFQAWCVEIKEILETVSVFDIDASQNPYNLLPP